MIVSIYQSLKIGLDKGVRFIRFNSCSFFSDAVLIVEGKEEICLDLLYQHILNKSLQEEGIVITRSVGGLRSNGSETSDLEAGGGKDQVYENVKFFMELNIQPLCLLDVDVLYGIDPTIKKIYKQLTGEEFELSQTYTSDTDTSYLKLKKWWIEHKNEKNLKNDIKKLNEKGIYIFPGDFEALFTEDYLASCLNNKSEIIKEKLSYDTLYLIESFDSDITLKLSEEGKNFLQTSYIAICNFISLKRSIIIVPVVKNDVTSSIQNEQLNEDDTNRIPF